ncbi:MAG: hypothetical protein SNJ56_06180 [Termitinemataceae bacterium]
MAELSTTYLGLPITNPLVIAASNLTESIDQIRKAVQAGPGALVVKSIFEEQIRRDMQVPQDQLEGAP